MVISGPQAGGGSCELLLHYFCDFAGGDARDTGLASWALAGNGLSEVVLSTSLHFSARSDLVVTPWNLSLAVWNNEPETAVGCPRS